MNSSIGYGLVLAGLAAAAFAAVVGLWSGLTRREALLPWVRNAIYVFCFSMLGSNLVMIESLLNHDFSVKYVTQVGSRATPTLYTIVSLWSALEGSILFWGAIMGAYLFAFAFTYRKEHGRYMQLSLGMMAVVAVFFAFLIAGPANPWTPVPNPPMDGPGPNPLLQNHPLMIIHPPMLYLGYVGMVVPFGIATGALLRERSATAGWCRCASGRSSRGRSSRWASSSAPGGRTRCSAGAATGRGTRWRTPRSCPGSPSPPSCTRRWCSSARRC